MPSADGRSEVVRRAAATLRERLTAIESQIAAGREPDAIYVDVSAALDDCLSQLRTTGLWGIANRLPSSELWNAAGEILCRGWLQNQARIKPRGYAGDYEMLSRIQEDRLCEDPLGPGGDPARIAVADRHYRLPDAKLPLTRFNVARRERRTQRLR